MDEIEQVMAMIDAAVGSATCYTKLASVTDKLGNSKDREASAPSSKAWWRPPTR